MRKFIVSSSLVAAAILAAVLEHLYSPWRNYFTMSIVAVFFLYWGVEFVLDYVDAVKGYEERYKLFLAEKVNKLNLPLDHFEKNRKKYFAQFKRSIAGERAMQIFKFLICFGLTIGLVVSMAL